MTPEPLHHRKTPSKQGQPAPPYPAGFYPGCPCYACDSPTWPTWADWMHIDPEDLAPGEGNPLMAIRMSLCRNCGNKRCPGAKDHRNACSGSNEPGQKGSLYENMPLSDFKPMTKEERAAFEERMAKVRARTENHDFAEELKDATLCTCTLIQDDDMPNNWDANGCPAHDEEMPKPGDFACGVEPVVGAKESVVYGYYEGSGVDGYSWLKINADDGPEAQKHLVITDTLSKAEERCDPQNGFHTTPHKGCILR